MRENCNCFVSQKTETMEWGWRKWNNIFLPYCLDNRIGNEGIRYVLSTSRLATRDFLSLEFVRDYSYLWHKWKRLYWGNAQWERGNTIPLIACIFIQQMSLSQPFEKSPLILWELTWLHIRGCILHDQTIFCLLNWERLHHGEVMYTCPHDGFCGLWKESPCNGLKATLHARRGCGKICGHSFRTTELKHIYQVGLRVCKTQNITHLWAWWTRSPWGCQNPPEAQGFGIPEIHSKLFKTGFIFIFSSTMCTPTALYK